MPEVNAIQHPPGLFAITEPAIRNDALDEQGWSSLITLWVIKPCTIPGYEEHNEQQLVPLERLTQPCIMVPDMDHPNERAFLKLGARKHWAKQFEDWLEMEHTRVCE